MSEDNPNIANRVVGNTVSTPFRQIRMDNSPRLLGRYTIGQGQAEEIKLGSGLEFVGDTLTITSGGTVDWDDITGKPSTFAPSAHASTHESSGSDPLTLAQSQITNLTTDLASKQPLDGDLTAIAALSSNGFIQRTGVNTWAQTIASFGGQGTSDSGRLIKYSSDGSAIFSKKAVLTDPDSNPGVSVSVVFPAEIDADRVHSVPNGDGFYALTTESDGTPSIFSANIIDATIGGIGNSDNGKAVLYSTAGTLAASAQIRFFDQANGTTSSLICDNLLTVSRSWNLPDSDGTVSVVSGSDGIPRSADIGDARNGTEPFPPSQFSGKVVKYGTDGVLMSLAKFDVLEVSSSFRATFQFVAPLTTDTVIGIPYDTGVLALTSQSDGSIIFENDVVVSKIITPTGTTGAQVINASSGSVNLAAAASSLVVTNSLVTTSSVIILTVGTSDIDMHSAVAVAGSGSFTIFPDTAPNAEVRVNFLVIN